MKKYFLNIRIGDKQLPPIQIYDGNEACKASSMKTLSCLISTMQGESNIPVVFEYIENCDGGTKLCHKESIDLVKQRSVIATLVSRMFGEHAQERISLDIFFNDTEEGLCIGFLSSKFKPAIYILNDEYRGGKQVEATPQVSNVLSAKEVFVSNYAFFTDLLKLPQENDKEWVSKWERVISSIPNSSDLQVELLKYKDNLETWIKLLLSWGLKKDGCRQYPGLLVDLNRYDLMDNEQIQENSNYIVVSPCWTIWIDANGTKVEEIVSKGILRRK